MEEEVEKYLSELKEKKSSEEEDFYEAEKLEEHLEDDLISGWEEGWMQGYLEG